MMGSRVFETNGGQFSVNVPVIYLHGQVVTTVGDLERTMDKVLGELKDCYDENIESREHIKCLMAEIEEIQNNHNKCIPANPIETATFLINDEWFCEK